MWKDWENINPFVYPLFLSFFLVCLHFYYRARGSASSLRPHCLLLQSKYLSLLYLLYGLCAVSLSLFVLFEHYYYSYNCTVSARYYQQNLVLAEEIFGILESNGIPYYPDAASLLNVVRNEEMNEWDHDLDISLEWPPPYSTVPGRKQVPLRPDLAALYSSSTGDRPLYLPNPNFQFNDLLSAFTRGGLFYVYNPDRDLLQVRRTQTGRASFDPHCDIWIWRRNFLDLGTKTHQWKTNIHEVEKQEGERDGPYALITPERSIRAFSRSFGLVYPLESTLWLGRNVTVPHLAHKLSQLEYGSNYMTPTVMRRDCMHNLFHGRFQY